MREREGGFLAKRATNSEGDSAAAKAKRAAKAIEREYVPLEDDPTAAGSAPEGAANEAHDEIKQAFHAGGFWPRRIPRKMHAGRV